MLGLIHKGRADLSHYSTLPIQASLRSQGVSEQKSSEFGA